MDVRWGPQEPESGGEAQALVRAWVLLKSKYRD